jgi:hypothetical protein
MGNSVQRYPGYGYGLAQEHASPGPQYLAAIIREAKCTRLGYGIRLIMLHTLDPLLVLAFPRNSHSATADSEQENNQETPDKLQVPQADPPVTGLHNSN